ncbi:MAG: response regulator [Lachnospiraceae bacterium]|nr:response regulator [Lachnospiraceae bacterium]
MKSFRAKITILLVLVVFGGSVLMSFFSYQRAKSSLMTQLQNNYSVAAQKYALELTSWVNTNATIIDTMAAEVAVNGITYQDYDAFHSYLKRSNDLLNKNGFVYDVYFTYPNNTMVCASDFIADGTVDFVHEREWYTTPALTGELFYATPYLDSDTNKSIITISKAVYKDGELLGVLAADIFVDVLVDMIFDADLDQGSYAFLIDQNMRMLVHPNEVYKYNDVPLKVTEVADCPYDELVSSIEEGSDDMIFVQDYDGITRGISTAKMTNTGWHVCIATSRATMEQEAGNLMQGFVIATIVSVGIGLVIAILLACVLDQLSKKEQEYRQQVLRLEKQAADEASEAKSRFLADMSHEIRTPINAIIGMNEMILREAGDQDILGYSRNIRQSGHNLLQLINGILDFSKIEDGKMEIVPVKYRVSEQVAYVLHSIQDRANAKKLELEFDIDPKLPSELFGDDTRINQVLNNLLTNAVKYTEKGKVTFTMTCREKKDGKARLYFEVKDTGIGIKESDMEKLFESFERLDVVRNRNIEGTGLGMTITVKLLELMGSKLSVESTYGEGSIFSFELIQKIESDEPLGDYREAMARAEDVAVYHESFRAPDARVLVVDDTRMNLLVVENLLKKTGISIDTAVSGPDSIELADEKHYDVILMDQRMPGMDGTEAMQKIRQLKSAFNKDTPIICLTADVVRGAKERYLKMGFEDYLTKPVEGAELEKMLVTYLPSHKIVKVSGEEADREGKADEAADAPGGSRKRDGLLGALGAIGVDTGAGLSYSGKDEETYRNFLAVYAAEFREKSSNLKSSFEDKNWKDYGVYVHSLKSTSKAIGATELSMLAAESEAAAAKGKASTCEHNHGRIMGMYENLVSVINEYISPAEEEAAIEDEDEILEFSPEDSFEK